MYVYKEKYWREEVNFTSQRNHVGTMLWIIVIGWGKGAYIYMVAGRRLKQFHMR